MQPLIVHMHSLIRKLDLEGDLANIVANCASIRRHSSEDIKRHLATSDGIANADLRLKCEAVLAGVIFKPYV